jgi:hypothetical protein
MDSCIPKEEEEEHTSSSFYVDPSSVGSPGYPVKIKSILKF